MKATPPPDARESLVYRPKFSPDACKVDGVSNRTKAIKQTKEKKFSLVNIHSSLECKNIEFVVIELKHFTA